MKKISILALHLGYGGIEKCIVNLANALCENYDIEIAVCYTLYDNPSFDIDKRVKIKYLDNDFIPFNARIRNIIKFTYNIQNNIENNNYYHYFLFYSVSLTTCH